MEFSMLDELIKYMQKRKPSFSAINCKFGVNVPAAVESVMKCYIKSTRLSYQNTDVIDSFNIIFTPDKLVYLEILSQDKHSRVIIIDNNYSYESLPASKIIKEKQFLEDVKNKDNLFMQNVLANLPAEFKSRFLKKENEVKNIEEMLKQLTQHIINYTEYCLQEKEKNIPNVFYTEPESSAISRTRNRNFPSDSQTERVNEEIDFNEREEILNSYESEIEFNATANNSNSVYRVTVYKPSLKTYKLVMEPIEGNKYTKVVHINKDNLSMIEAQTIAISALQLSRNETSQDKTITRHAHTSIDEYRRLLEYIATKANNGLNEVKKKAIEEAEEAAKTR